MAETWLFNPGQSCCVAPSGCDSLAGRPLYLTDANGTHELAYDPTTPAWRCCYAMTHPTTVPTNSSCTPVAAGTIRVGYQFRCFYAPPAASSPLSVASLRQESYAVIGCGGGSFPFSRAVDCVLHGGTALDNASVVALAAKDGQVDAPFLAEFTVPATVPGPGGVGPVPTALPGTVVVSE